MEYRQGTHTIAEELILPAAIDMVSVMLDEASVAKLKTIPVSNDTMSRRIHDIANDIEEQLIEKIKGKRYALQVDEATDSNKDSLLIAYVRFVDFESLNEDLLFCKYIPKRATADELLKLLIRTWQRLGLNGRTAWEFARTVHRPWRGNGEDCRRSSRESHRKRSGHTALYIGKHLHHGS